MTTNYYDVTEATWAPASKRALAGCILRDGAGGGKRVSAATLAGTLANADLASVEKAMRDMDQFPLFMIRQNENDLDEALAGRGYKIIDPVTIYTAEISSLTKGLPPLACFSLFPPLAIMKDIWKDAGIGPERIAVMDRVNQPKTTILGRAQNHAAGVAFVAIHHETAMLHALEVKSDRRRQGVAVNMMYAAANWAQDNGAKQLSVVVTQANKGANTLYTSLGMRPVGQYHYRILHQK